MRGTAQNDVLKEYVARGTYIYPPRPSLRLAADLVAWCASEAPRFNAISLSGYHMREAGSTAVQEMAFALANAIAYVEAVLAHGVAVDDFAPRLSWIFNTHTDFFEEIAKYRALRRMWATLMRDRFGARDPRSLQLRTHTQTGGLQAILVPTYEPSGPFGAKAVAEIPMDGVAPAVANAVFDAVGARVRRLPLLPERVWRAMRIGADGV